VLTAAAVAASAEATSARLRVDPDRDRWLACLPLAHVGGLSVVTRALHTGTPLTVLPAPDPAAVEAAARTGGATLVSLVATASAGWTRPGSGPWSSGGRRRPPASRPTSTRPGA
jgi:O-succinylbenzoic acid--CoA ligase